LHQDGHGIGPEQDPEEFVAEAGATVDVGGEVAGVDVGDTGDKGGAKVGPKLAAAKFRQQAEFLPAGGGSISREGLEHFCSRVLWFEIRHMALLGD